MGYSVNSSDDSKQRKYAAEFASALTKAAQDELRKVMEQREEILRACVAKYGFEPDQLVQVEIKGKLGMNTWMVRVRSEEEIELLHRIQSAEIKRLKSEAEAAEQKDSE